MGLTKFMNKLFNIFYKFRIIILSSFIIFTFWWVFRLYEDYSKFHITVKFEESGPLYKNMPVCYKGCEIGRTQKVTLSDDYKYTYVRIILYPKNPKLSQNVEGVVKKHDVLKNYIDLVNQDPSSKTLLKNEGVIDGKPLFDMGTFLAEIADSGVLIPLIQNFSDVAVNWSKTSKEVKNFFSDSRLILGDNRQNLKQTTKNFASTSKSLKNVTSRFNNSITEDKLNNTTSSISKSSANILTTTENVKNITGNIDNATKNLDKTVAKIDCTLSEANAVASNARVITGGFCRVLKKRFAGLRIIFGKPLDK